MTFYNHKKPSQYPFKILKTSIKLVEIHIKYVNASLTHFHTADLELHMTRTIEYVLDFGGETRS